MGSRRIALTPPVDESLFTARRVTLVSTGAVGPRGPRGFAGASGGAFTGTAAVAISAQRLVVLDSSGVRYFDQTDVAEAGRTLGVATNAAAIGGAVNIITGGVWNAASGLTTDALYWANGADGQVSSVRPTSGLLVSVGYAALPTQLVIAIHKPVILS